MGLMDEASRYVGVPTPIRRKLRLVSDEPAQTASEALNARPEALSEFIGQTSVVFDLSVECMAAEMDDRLPSHMLLEGPPGLGKTSLAKCVADRLGVRFVEIPGTAMMRVNDAAQALSRIGEPESGPAVVFVDEIHIICRKAQTMLLSALEDGWFQPTGAEKIHLAPFTLIAASTDPGKLDRPMLDRFGVREELEYYSEDELKAILLRYAATQGVTLDEDAADHLALVGRGTPRIANSLFRRCAAFAKVARRDSVTLDVVEESLEQMGIDHHGMEPKDRRLLTALVGQSAPIGIQTLSAILETDMETVKSREGYLIRLGLLRRTGQGRVLTRAGYRALGEIPPVFVPMV